jgi:hypothetical protein
MEVKELCKESYKPLRKKSKKTTEDRRSSHIYGLVNQYFENGYITKSNLQVQCNPHQNSNDIHHRN